ncbi:site-specific integrase [Planctomycetota bacterium]
MKNFHLIANYVQPFFYRYLVEIKGSSPCTILSYRDTLKLLLRFSASELHKSSDRLTIEDLNEKVILSFLNYLERCKGNSFVTRNARLAGIRSFFSYVAREAPEILDQCRKIRLIPRKRTEHRTIEYLEAKEMKAMFDVVDMSSRTGLRDRALLLTLYNTGARVQEIVDLSVIDLKLEPPSQVKMLGKGRKQRACPLWPETVEALKSYISSRDSVEADNQRLFLNTNGKPLTRFGVRYIIKSYAQKASNRCPSLKDKVIGPHTFRHSTAMHLIQAGNDINMVRIWLGHTSISTTHIYIEIDMDMKRKILESTNPPMSKVKTKKLPKWQKPNILKWLDDLSQTLVSSR